MLTNCIPQSIKTKEDKKTILIPRLKSGGLPLGIKDLQLYFKRRIPQVISFMQEC